jgi:hypothetical protein
MPLKLFGGISDILGGYGHHLSPVKAAGQSQKHGPGGGQQFKRSYQCQITAKHDHPAQSPDFTDQTLLSVRLFL